MVGVTLRRSIPALRPMGSKQTLKKVYQWPYSSRCEMVCDEEKEVHPLILFIVVVEFQ